jgi:hypothetical protein
MELLHLFIDHYPFHDAAIKQENTEFMAAHIPNAGLLPQPKVSHLLLLQDPVVSAGSGRIQRRRAAYPGTHKEQAIARPRD